MLPTVAIALVSVALWWTPSRNIIANGPLAPFWRIASERFDQVAVPFHFAAQNEVIADRNHEILTLRAQLASAQAQSASKDKLLADLKAQMAQLQTQAASSRSSGSPAPASPGNAGASPAPFGQTAQAGPAAGGDLTAGATPDMRRTAQYWASMEPENAAKVVQRLPVNYVARILALMSPDAAGAVLDALPPTFAAQLTQEDPELRR